MMSKILCASVLAICGHICFLLQACPRRGKSNSVVQLFSKSYQVEIVGTGTGPGSPALLPLGWWWKPAGNSRSKAGSDELKLSPAPDLSKFF